MPGLNSDTFMRGCGIRILPFARQVPGRGRGQPIFPLGGSEVWLDYNRPDGKRDDKCDDKPDENVDR